QAPATAGVGAARRGAPGGGGARFRGLARFARQDRRRRGTCRRCARGGPRGPASGHPASGGPVIPDDIQALTAQLARDPGSLVFLPLAESLRRRGQLDAALTVAVAGSARYPEMAGAYDLIARIRSDRGEGDLAFDACTTVL